MPAGIRLSALFLALLAFGFLSSHVVAGPLIGIVESDATGGTEPKLPMGPFTGTGGTPQDPGADAEVVGGGIVTSNPSDIWIKEFVWDFSGDSINPGDRLCIKETITIFNAPTGAGLTVADWHETILDGRDGFEWERDTAGLAATFGATPLPWESGVSDDGQEIWFDFDPIRPGPQGSDSVPPLVLEITKYLVYTGDVPITSGGGDAQISFFIAEQPSAPEPSTALLTAIAALGIRRRSR